MVIKYLQMVIMIPADALAPDDARTQLGTALGTNLDIVQDSLSIRNFKYAFADETDLLQ